MCDQCILLDKRLKLQEDKPAITPAKWWGGIVVTILIFVLTQVFVYGKVVATIENHIALDPTYKQMTEEFSRKEEVNRRLDSIEKMIQYLYQKQGGK